MTREIKFKAWSPTEYGRGMSDIFFLFSTRISFDGGASYHDLMDLYDNLEIRQFTGLRDKNGTEIFEGDILQFLDVMIGPVLFECCEFIAGEFALSPQATNSDEVFEVIGNVHQHPELLP